MEKYRLILPADVYVTMEQWRTICKDRKEGRPHPEITTIRLTGNNFFDLFASLVDGGCGIQGNVLAKRMGVKPSLLGPAIEAMSGLSAHEWAVQYVHMAACDRLRHNREEISSIARSLGFASVSAFSHFFYRLEHCHPSQFRGL